MACLGDRFVLVAIASVILNATILRTHLLRRMIQDLITVCGITFFEHTLCIARCTVCVSYYAVCRFLTMHSVGFLLCTVSVSYYARCVFLTTHGACFLLCRGCVSYYAQCVFLTVHSVCFLLCRGCVSYYAYF